MNIKSLFFTLFLGLAFAIPALAARSEIFPSSERSGYVIPLKPSSIKTYKNRAIYKQTLEYIKKKCFPEQTVHSLPAHTVLDYLGISNIPLVEGAIRDEIMTDTLSNSKIPPELLQIIRQYAAMYTSVDHSSLLEGTARNEIITDSLTSNGIPTVLIQLIARYAANKNITEDAHFLMEKFNEERRAKYGPRGEVAISSQFPIAGISQHNPFLTQFNPLKQLLTAADDRGKTARRLQNTFRLRLFNALPIRSTEKESSCDLIYYYDPATHQITLLDGHPMGRKARCRLIGTIGELTGNKQIVLPSLAPTCDIPLSTGKTLCVRVLDHHSRIGGVELGWCIKEEQSSSSGERASSSSSSSSSTPSHAPILARDTNEQAHVATRADAEGSSSLSTTSTAHQFGEIEGRRQGNSMAAVAPDNKLSYEQIVYFLDKYALGIIDDHMEDFQQGYNVGYKKGQAERA